MDQSTIIEVVTEEKDAPITLCSRFGEWIAGRGPVGEWSNYPKPYGASLSDRLALVYSEGVVECDGVGYYVGDPRLFLGEREFSVVAVLPQGDGRYVTGVLIEVELAYVDGGLDSGGDTAIGSEQVVLSKKEFAEAVLHWQCNLEEVHREFPCTSLVQPGYPGAKFFLMHGATSFEGRLTLACFVPLVEGNDLCYSLPQEIAEKITQIEERLLRMTD